MTEDPLRPWAERPPHLQRFDDTRSGVERVYWRRGKGTKIALKQPWGTQALADEAKEVAARVAARQKRPAIGTLVGAVKAYRGDRALGIEASADYLALTPATQIEYDRWLDRFETAFAGVLLEELDAGLVLDLRDKWAKRGYRAANLGLQVLKNVCKAPRIRGEIAGDPFALIEKVKRPHELGEPNPRWLDTEVEAAIEWAIEKKMPGLANAIGLGRYGGFRKQTMASVPRRARIKRATEAGGTERRIYWVTEKRKVLCDRREDPRLTALLERTDKARRRGEAKVEPLTIAYNAYGGGFTARALGRAIDRAIKDLSTKGKVRDVLTPHGLRHARGVELALTGASDAEIMAQLDHATPRQAANYRRQAERLKLADAAQDRVDAEIVRLKPKLASEA